MVQTFLKECMERLQISKVSISIGSTEEFYWQIYCKKMHFDRAFYVTIADADILSPKSLNTLYNKYLDHMLVKFEQNRMVKTMQNFVLCDKQWLTIIEVLTPFWMTFLWN